MFKCVTLLLRTQADQDRQDRRDDIGILSFLLCYMSGE